MSTAPLWEITGLRKRYTTSWFPRKTHDVLDDVTLTVQPGERIGIIGLSGSGKTTLARCGLGLLPFDAGKISLFGQDTASWSPSDWRAARRRAQLLFQDSRAMLHPDLPIQVLLEESAALHRPEADRVDAANAVLAAVALEHRAMALPRELSGGERRRAGIARVLLARPELLVVDEPTSGLDAVLKMRMLHLIVGSVEPSCAIVLVTHDLGAVVPVTDRIVVLHEGRIIESLSSSAIQTGCLPSESCTAELLAASGFATSESASSNAHSVGVRAGPFGGTPW